MAADPASQVPRPPTLAEQVGLALRAHRRQRGESQRAYARRRGLGKSTLARLEAHAGRFVLTDVEAALEATGCRLVLVADAVAADLPATAWDPSDLIARDRAHRRFPAHREVHDVPDGPTWWWYHEVLGGRWRADRPAPRWTAEGFIVPLGTRYGPAPRPCDPGEGPRFPAVDLDRDLSGRGWSRPGPAR